MLHNMYTTQAITQCPQKQIPKMVKMQTLHCIIFEVLSDVNEGNCSKLWYTVH